MAFVQPVDISQPTAPEFETATNVVASENLTAGQFVNLWDDAGTMSARKANATNNTKPCHGFVEDTVVTGETVRVICDFGASNTLLSGLSKGVEYYLSTTGGGSTSTAPSASGNISQAIGVAVSATAMVFRPQPPVEIT